MHGGAVEVAVADEDVLLAVFELVRDSVAETVSVPLDDESVAVTDEELVAVSDTVSVLLPVDSVSVADSVRLTDSEDSVEVELVAVLGIEDDGEEVGLGTFLPVQI